MGGVHHYSVSRQSSPLYDTGTTLNYMDARYYDASTGRFLSEDPPLISMPSGQSLQAFLSDPQKLNFYSYVENNPLRYTDPTGLYTQQQNNAIAALAAAFGVTTFSAAQSSAIGGLASSFGVATPLITNLTGVSVGSLGGGGGSGSSVQLSAPTPASQTPSYIPSSNSYTSTMGSIPGTSGTVSGTNRDGRELRGAFGVCGGGGIGAGGYTSGQGCAVLTFHDFGFTYTQAGGGTTGVVGGGGPQFMLSNAQRVQDLAGVSVGGGASAEIGGGDYSYAKNGVWTVSGGPAIKLSETPPIVPAEVHGVAGYTWAWTVLKW